MPHPVRLLVAACLGVTLPAALTAQEPPADAEVEFLSSDAVLSSAELPFSEAVRVGDVLYLSGQVGIRPGTLELVKGGVEAEARQTLANIRAVLEAHGWSLADVVKCTVMLADISEWETFNEVYVSVFSPPYPARSAFGTDGLALGARVEVECVAAREHGSKTGGGGHGR